MRPWTTLRTPRPWSPRWAVRSPATRLRLVTTTRIPRAPVTLSLVHLASRTNSPRVLCLQRTPRAPCPRAYYPHVPPSPLHATLPARYPPSKTNPLCCFPDQPCCTTMKPIPGRVSQKHSNAIATTISSIPTTRQAARNFFLIGVNVLSPAGTFPRPVPGRQESVTGAPAIHVP